LTPKFDVVYDISVSLGEESIDYPGTTPYSREVVMKKEDGEAYNISKLVMSTHSGTHVDTPLHYIDGGKNLDEFPIERWILPAHVVDVNDKEAVRPSELEGLSIKPGDALLFKTDNSISGRSASGIFSYNFVYISPEAADFCVARKVSLVGIDYNTCDKDSDLSFPVHYKLLGNDILILESINLKGVSAGKYTLICLPLKIKGGEGAPVRAILVR